MLTTRRAARANRAVPALRAAVLASVLFAACSSAAAPPNASSGPDASSAPSLPAGSAGGAGGSTGDPGTGVGVPIDPTPVDPGAGQPALQVPKPGRLNPHPVSAQSLQASVDGRHVLVKVAWYGGIAPCSVLDSVNVERGEGTIALTVIEGADQADAICAEIAMLKATIVDLGELEPGTWTITAPNSDAQPITVVID